MANDHIAVAVISLFFILSALGWGDILSKFLRPPGITLVQDLAGRFVLGCSALYALFIGLSAVGRLHRLEAGIALGLGLAAATVNLYGLVVRIATGFAKVKNWPLTDAIILVLVLSLTLFQAILGLTPLVFYDTQAYHFFVPAQFLIAGTFTQTPWNVYANSPLAMQFTAGMSLALDVSGQSAKLIFAMMGGLLVFGAYELLRPAGRRPALLAALFVICYPEFWVMQALGHIDLAIAALMLFGTIWIREAFSKRTLHFAILSGLAFGLALGSRYQAVILVTWILLVTLVEAYKQPRLVRYTSTVVALAFLVVSPWLLRNYVNLGNPVFPLMQSVWTNGEWSAEQSRLVDAEVLGPSIAEIPATQKVIAPIRALIDPAANGLFGLPMLLASLIGLRNRQSNVRIASLLGLGGLIAWGFLIPAGGVPLMRFNALSLVFLLAATGGLLGSWMKQGWGDAVAFSLAGGSFIIAMFHVHSIFPAVPSLTNGELREAMHRSSIPSWEVFDYVNTNLERRHVRVLLLGETRGFWAQVPAIVPSAFNGPQLSDLFGNGSNPEEWIRRLKQLGITHLIVSPVEIERLRKIYGYLTLEPQQRAKLESWLGGLPKLFEDRRGNFVAEVPD